MTTKLNWQIYISGERNEAIEDLKDLISKNNGYIMNFNLFSDLAMSLTVEIEEKDVRGLYSSISNQMKIDESSLERLGVDSSKNCWILMNVSFSKGQGYHKNEIPDVPG